jgi:shikimate kinase
MAGPDPIPRLPEGMCISLIGMAGAGKSTVGKALARALDWAFVDTDHVIEAAYAADLQEVADALDREAFLAVEAEIIRSLQVRRCVLATGGSAVYRRESMEYLATLGPIVHLDAPLPLIRERIAGNPDRGLVRAPGQTVEDLFREREELYRRYASFSLPVGDLTPPQCAGAILALLGECPSPDIWADGRTGKH